METIIEKTKDKMDKTISNLEKRFTNIRAGRANPNIVDNIMIDYYNTPTSIKTLANISVPEARQLMIKPFDKSILADIEKAIFEADIGLTPNNNGECIYLVIPPLTEERRKQLVKEAKTMAEDAKINLRNIRMDANKEIVNLKLPEDEEKKASDRIQKLINDYNKIIDDTFKEKEKDLMTI